MASPIQKILTRFSRSFSKKARSISSLILASLQGNEEDSRQTENKVNQAWTAAEFVDWFTNALHESIKVSFEQNGPTAPKLLPELTEAWDDSGMTLSEKIHGADKEMRNKIVSTIREQQKQSKHAMQAARALYDGYNAGRVTRQQPLPKYLADIVSFARRSDLTETDQAALLSKVRRAQRLVNRLGQNGAPNIALRSAYSELLKAVAEGTQKALERSIRTAVEEKSRYVAERVARTEAARAWADGFLTKYQLDDTVVAYKWKLSSRHPEYDICNLYAEANLWGLGPGVFPKDKTPNLPVHPHCLCHLAPVYRSELGRDRHPVDRVDEAGNEWVSKQSPAHQKRLLGVSGYAQFQRGTGWQKLAKNYSTKYLESPKLNGAIEKKRDIIKEKVEKTNFKFEGLNYPPRSVDAENLKFDSNHVKTQQHDITEREAKSMIQRAVISFTRWKGRCEIYCAVNGWVYVLDEKIIRTAFRGNEFDAGALKVVEVLKDEGVMPDN